MRHLIIAALSALFLTSPALAQSAQQTQTYLDARGDRQTAIGMTCIPAKDGSGCSSPRESYQLITANTPNAAVSVYGGDYILSQTCTTYGTLNLQALGPDGVTWQTILSKTASDTSGGTGMSLGSYAQVRITVTGTTGCNAILARVPA